MLRKCVLLMSISAGVFIVSILLHNALSTWFGIEEGILISIAIFVAPVAFVVGTVGSIVLVVKRLRMTK